MFNDSEYEEITNLADIEGISADILLILKNAGIETIEQFDNADAEGSLASIENLSEDDIESVRNALDAAENYDEH